MVNLANGFVKSGFEVDLLLVRREGIYLSQLDAAVQVIDLQANKLLFSLPKLIAYLKQVKPDNLITALEDTNIVAIFARLMAQVPTRLIVTVHNNLSQEMLNGEGLKRRLVPTVLKWIYPFADQVVAVSQGVAEDLKRLGVQPDKIRVIYNPILTPDFSHLATAVPQHQWLLQPDEPVVLGVGRLELQKDFETLIRAFALAKKKQPMRLMILGEGSQKASLEALCQQLEVTDSTVFVGFVSNPLACMSRAALCVLSSAWEGFGNVLVEAMGVGTPVVATDCPSGPAEILEQGKYGQLVPVGDVERLADAMLMTLGDPLDAAVLQRRAADFSVEAVLDEYQKLLA